MELNSSNFTTKLFELIVESGEKAKKYNHVCVDTEHVLEAFFETDSSVVTILKNKNINIKNIKRELSSNLSKKKNKKSHENILADKCFLNFIKRMETISEQREDEVITMEVAFIALSMDKKCSKILENHGVKSVDIKNKFNEIRKGKKEENINKNTKHEFIDRFTNNLTKRAKNGEIDPIIGRDKEIRRAIQVLLRKTKNNPVFIGKSGVGKTALAEGLALRIINKEVPEGLEGKELLTLDMGLLMAGAKYQGDIEERLTGLIAEIKETNGRCILFIDEMHLLIGSGKSGSMDAANLLKPELARGQMHVIGATTLDEYRMYVEKDPALERRFQKVLVEEPTIEDTIAILRGIKEKYEIHHGIEITDDSLVAATVLSNRYITDRQLPDKAIDLMDEAASVVRMEIESKPEKMDILSRKIIQKEIELKSLKVEDKKYNDIKDIILVMKKEYSTLEEKWLNEKALVSGENEIRESLDELKIENDIAKRTGDLERSSEICYSLIPDLEKRLKEAKNQNKNNMYDLLRNKVTDNEIKEVISRWTGIPVNKMSGEETKLLMNLEKEISKRVIGQEEAIKSVSSSIRRSRAGLSDPNKPIGSFLFLGSTGVGKTEMCKAVSNVLFERQDDFIRIDMSEYMEKHNVSRLIGSPPGYIGHGEGGELTEAVRVKPYSVILFDEIEKAHPDVFNILLQVLDDGRLTDTNGNVVNFKNTLIIMTSNLGAEVIQESVANNETYEEIKEKTYAELEDELRPEFINRIDSIVVFKPLTIKNVEKIAKIQIGNLNKRLADKNMSLNLTPSAMIKLVEKGFDQYYGARPLKRAIQEYIENPLADDIIGGIFKSGDKIKTKVVKGVITFTK